MRVQLLQLKNLRVTEDNVSTDADVIDHNSFNGEPSA